MFELLNFRNILKLLERGNGKTSYIKQQAVEHLMIGNAVLFIVVRNSAYIGTLKHEIYSVLPEAYKGILVSIQGHEIKTDYSTVRFITYNSLLSDSQLCGLRCNDILFDCPELLFDIKLFEKLIPILSRDK
jgi:hypothetical protein